ncbi:MAG TPA: glycoside hydrolase family 172 protein [Terriglobales bacterium]|nr:glycoside hydrolase family 172 protein [Terriglobales bacterium]
MLALGIFAVGSVAGAQIQDLYKITDGRFAAHVEYHQVNLAPGEEIVLADIAGPGKITYFYYTDDSNQHPAQGTGFMYPGLVLKAYWDNATEPSIEVPLWNFFGAFGRKTIDYQSLPMQINHYCYMSYLPMPFSSHARLVLTNDGDERYSRSVAWGVDYDQDSTYANQASRLHAAYNRSNPTQNSLHTILQVKGRGQYIGNFLQVNTNYEGWWGEGDTIFDIDGNKLTHTPGTEDEYGSTWFFEHTYSYVYSGYIQMDEGKNRMYRWYLANPVRFQKSLQVDIQNQRYQNGQTPSQDDYTSVAFWYQEGAHAAPTILPYRSRIAPSRGATYSRPE